MATSQTIIDRATGLLRVRQAGETYSSDDSIKNAEIFAILQNLIAEWVEDGLVNVPAPSAVTDDLDIPPGTVRALVFNLAVEAEPEYGAKLAQQVFVIAERTKDRLEADISLDLSVDMSDLAFSSNYNINTDR